ncbi:MAG TPA: tRNA (adenosine(37)-N6)-threonylcarbamoyltransferase complex ATPase subunit type 1 TsaE [Candidatus Polarisedimenticolia bacterium]|nr:tRNA (adenosine(37)-N6)-threonylcarbamoyltransferase complex ATPase subunit type 1 TsaE [Candidatus Polarisedimenticolia bacterium]
MHDESATLALGASLAAHLSAGDVVLMEGALGSGKTALARGIAAGLGVLPEQVHSPTFTLVNHYLGRLPVYHIDLYRIQKPSDLLELGLEELLGTDGVALVEWPERLGSWLPDKVIRVSIQDRGGSLREIRVVDRRAGGNQDSVR